MATDAALEHAAAALWVRVEVGWLDTATLNDLDVAKLAAHDALWGAPGSPYQSLDGALRAIRFARESDCLFIGTCGGFQHVVIEYARNALGFEDAQHAEYDPHASELRSSSAPSDLRYKPTRITLGCTDELKAPTANLQTTVRMGETWLCASHALMAAPAVGIDCRVF